MVFQNYALYPHMTVAENMGFALKLRGLNKSERDAQVLRGGEAAGPGAVSWTASRRRSRAGSGSGWRWVGRSSASPAVFLMDEPLSNLDAKLRVETRAQIAALQARLGTTHDLRDARPGRGDDDGRTGSRCSRTGCCSRPTPRNLYDRPGNVFVAGFIGSRR